MKLSACAIAFANSKGGTGKSTLLANLAVRIAQDGNEVALLDYDPQASLARWWELRGEPDNPRLWKNGKGARYDVPVLKKHGAQWVLIDVPPATMHLISEGVKASDYVLIPVKASPIDLEAVDPVIEACRAHRKPFDFILTAYDPRWDLSQTAAPYLERKAKGRVLPEVMSYRQAYVGAMIGGQTGPEYNGDAKQAKAAAAEVDAIWKAVRKRALSAVRVG